MLDWHSDELDGAIRRADVVVVDMPPNLHERTFAVIDGRFLGRTVVLLQEGEHAEALPPGPPRAILYRPLQIAELWAAVTGAGPDEGRGLKGEVPGPGFEPVGSEEESGPDVGLAAADDAVAGAEERPGAEIDVSEPDSEPEAGAEDQVAAMQGPGLPVGESGMLIGLSGRELEPVVGPGQVAPGMDEETFERLRRWGSRGRQLASGTAGTAGARRANGTRAGRASAEARREQSRRQRVAKAEAKAATREEVARQRAARAEARDGRSRAGSPDKAGGAPGRRGSLPPGQGGPDRGQGRLPTARPPVKGRRGRGPQGHPGAGPEGQGRPGLRAGHRPRAGPPGQSGRGRGGKGR
jgi:hypothetical protein